MNSNMLDFREYYRRNLPHFQPKGATFLVNFRLAGSLPSEAIAKLRAQAEQVEQRFREEKGAEERSESQKFWQRRYFEEFDKALHDTNHGPFFLREDAIAEIMHNIKRNSAKQANKILNRKGMFWQHENYDHYIRNNVELQRTIEYVLLNPVKAGLVDDWTEWKWSYLNMKYDM
jgi:REP element-mobilizing transposase RayT